MRLFFTEAQFFHRGTDDNPLPGIIWYASQFIEIMKSSSRIFLPIAATIFLTMCSNPSEPEPNIPLSEIETGELLDAMLVVLSDTMPQVTATRGPGDITIACPEGGESRVSFSATDEKVSGDTVSTTTIVNFIPEGCGIMGDRGTRFTLDANPGIDYTITLSIVGFFEDFGVDGGLDGQLDWMVENRSGTCQMDMELELVVDDDQSAVATLVGNMCGHDLSRVNTTLFDPTESGETIAPIRIPPAFPR